MKNKKLKRTFENKFKYWVTKLSRNYLKEIPRRFTPSE
jgi:lipocalin